MAGMVPVEPDRPETTVPHLTTPVRLAAAVGLALSGAAWAQTDNPAWLDQLAEQIGTAEQCEVGFYIFIDEAEQGGLKTQIARVQCVDGRQFDAARTEPDTAFTIKECGTRVC
jgi:hypothetical protein